MAGNEISAKLTALPFPPLTKSHVLNCSYHSWYPRYRALTPKARLIALSEPFVRYLRSDGIVLPDEDDDHASHAALSDNDSGIFSATDNEDENDDTEEPTDPATEWRDLHENIKRTIAALGGKVVPKLNWSAPKDATWISATNSMECVGATDVYLLLKSSDFVTHDLEHAFDDCVEEETSKTITKDTIPYHLVLRKYFQLNPSLEFRCFVREKEVIAICQRDLNHFDFLADLQDDFREKIQVFFNNKLKLTFPDENFAFDVYIPPPHDRVWLIDINPWAKRTDPLLFSWLELLTVTSELSSPSQSKLYESEEQPESSTLTAKRFPIFRLIRKDDPEAYSFATPQYSAHKLPKDVVDASLGGELQLRDFADRWKELVDRSQSRQAAESEDD